jgi:hypothetical protein
VKESSELLLTLHQSPVACVSMILESSYAALVMHMLHDIHGKLKIAASVQQRVKCVLCFSSGNESCHVYGVCKVSQ